MAKSSETKKPTPKKGSGEGPDVPAENQGYDRVAEITGTTDENAQSMIFRQVQEAAWIPSYLDEKDRRHNQLGPLKMMHGIKPKDEVEGMLAAQMVSTHNAAMECMRRAMLPEQTYEGRDQNLKHAAKLLSIYSRQMEVLDKHRGKGQQKVTVEYVNVESGGQAVVGNIEAGEPARRRKETGNGSTKSASEDDGDIIEMPPNPDGEEGKATNTVRKSTRRKRARKS